MRLLTKSEVLTIMRRVYGPSHAEAMADRLPDRIDLDDEADVELLFQLGVSRDGLLDALGGEL